MLEKHTDKLFIPLILFQSVGEANEIKTASHLPVHDQLFWPVSLLLIIRLNQAQAAQTWHWLHLGSCSEGSRLLILLLPQHGMDVSGRKDSSSLIWRFVTCAWRAELQLVNSLTVRAHRVAFGNSRAFKTLIARAIVTRDLKARYLKMQ